MRPNVHSLHRARLRENLTVAQLIKISHALRGLSIPVFVKASESTLVCPSFTWLSCVWKRVVTSTLWPL
jgi:hypothetical protein